MLLNIFSDYLNFKKTIFVKLKFTLNVFKQVRNPYGVNLVENPCLYFPKDLFNFLCGIFTVI